MQKENSEETKYLSAISQATVRILSYFFCAVFIMYAVVIIIMKTSLFATFFISLFSFAIIFEIVAKEKEKERIREELGLKKEKSRINLQLRVLFSELIRVLLYPIAGYFWLRIMEIVVSQHHFSLETFLIGILMAYGFSTAPSSTHEFIERYFLDLKPE